MMISIYILDDDGHLIESWSDRSKADLEDSKLEYLSVLERVVRIIFDSDILGQLGCGASDG